LILCIYSALKAHNINYDLKNRPIPICIQSYQIGIGQTRYDICSMKSESWVISCESPIQIEYRPIWGSYWPCHLIRARYRLIFNLYRGIQWVL